MDHVKALTISQPYASLIAAGLKWVENRQWGTDYRGPLAIHAGTGEQFTMQPWRRYPTSQILAVCRLVTCVDLRSDELRENADELEGAGLTIVDVLRHEYTSGPVCWVLDDVRCLSYPTGANGRPGLWESRRQEVLDVAAMINRKWRDERDRQSAKV